MLLFLFNDPATTEIYTLSLHDALPICHAGAVRAAAHRALRLRDLQTRGTARASVPRRRARARVKAGPRRSEEHTSELQSQSNLVCRLLLEKKKTGCARSYDSVREHTGA